MTLNFYVGSAKRRHTNGRDKWGKIPGGKTSAKPGACDYFPAAAFQQPKRGGPYWIQGGQVPKVGPSRFDQGFVRGTFVQR